MADLERQIEQCTAEEREQILSVAYFVAFADGRFWREVSLLDRIRRELDVPAKMARRLKNRANSPRSQLTVPGKRAARKLAYHYALVVAASDGKVHKRERKIVEMLGGHLAQSKEEVVAELDTLVAAEEPKPRRRRRSRRDRLQVGGHARTAELITRMIGVVSVLVGCAPVVAVIFGALVLDETIEYWLVPIFSLMMIAVGVGFLCIGRAKFAPRKSRSNAPPLMAFLIGCAFALAGLLCVTDAIANLEDMKKPFEASYVPGDMDDEGGYALTGGFAQGIQAFMGMLFFSIGIGLAAAKVTRAFGPRGRLILRGVAAVLALVWHAVGIAACYCYCTLAPEVDVWPFLVVMVYEWLGLIPLALAIPWDGVIGRLHSAMWHAMGGGFLGGFAGALIGGLAGGVAVLLSYAGGTGIVGTDWWLYSTMAGGAVTSIAFGLLRLTGWEIPTGDGQPTPRKNLNTTSHSIVCRRCRIPLEAGLAECPFCHAPVHDRRVWLTGPMFTRAGVVCLVATLGLYFLQTWQTFKGLDATGRHDAQTYIFWLLFFGGWLMIGIGSLLSSSKPVRGSPSVAGGANQSKGGTASWGKKINLPKQFAGVAVALTFAVVVYCMTGGDGSDRKAVPSPANSESGMSDERTFSDIREVSNYFETQGYTMLGRFEKSNWPARVVYEKVAINEISFVLKEGGAHTYPGYVGYGLKVVALEDSSGAETVVVLRSQEKIESPTTP